jgi:hypothetical protein
MLNLLGSIAYQGTVKFLLSCPSVGVLKNFSGKGLNIFHNALRFAGFVLTRERKLM